MVISINSSIIFVLLVFLWLVYVFPFVLRKYSSGFATLKRPFWKKSVVFFTSRKSFFSGIGFNLKDGGVMRKSLRFCKLLRGVFIFAGFFALGFLLVGLVLFGFNLVSWVFVAISFGVFVVSVVGLRWLAVRIVRISRSLVVFEKQVLKNVTSPDVAVVAKESSVGVVPADVGVVPSDVGVAGLGEEDVNAVVKYTSVEKLAEKKWSPVPVPRPVYLDADKVVRPKSEFFSETVYDIFAEGFDVFESGEIVSLENNKADEIVPVKAIGDLDDILQRRRVSGD